MSVTIRIPTVMQRHTDGQAEVQAQGATVREALDSLTAQHKAAREQLFNEAGELHRFVVVAVNGEAICFKQKLDTPIHSGDDVAIYPAVSSRY